MFLVELLMSHIKKSVQQTMYLLKLWVKLFFVLTLDVENSSSFQRTTWKGGKETGVRPFILFCHIFNYQGLFCNLHSVLQKCVSESILTAVRNNNGDVSELPLNLYYSVCRLFGGVTWQGDIMANISCYRLFCLDTWRKQKARRWQEIVSLTE